jgi:hypothetical protein
VRLAPTPRAQRISRGTVICGFYGLLLLAAVGVGAWRDHPNVFLLRASRPGDPLRFLGAPLGLAIGLAVALATRFLTHSTQWARTLHREFHALVAGLGARDILLLAISSAVAEEAFFRGALQPMVGVVLQSLLFAAMHFRPQRRFLPWTAMSLVIGLGFGVLANWLGDLSAPIVAHFTINLVNLSYISRTELRA